MPCVVLNHFLLFILFKHSSSYVFSVLLTNTAVSPPWGPWKEAMSAQNQSPELLFPAVLHVMDPFWWLKMPLFKKSKCFPRI